MKKQTPEPLEIEMVPEEEHRRRLLGLSKGINTPLTDGHKRAERNYEEAF